MPIIMLNSTNFLEKIQKHTIHYLLPNLWPTFEARFGFLSSQKFKKHVDIIAECQKTWSETLSCALCSSSNFGCLRYILVLFTSSKIS